MSRQQESTVVSPVSEATKLPSIYDTYFCTEPAGDLPLLIRNGPDEYTALLRTLQRSADHFAERDQARVVERLQFEMATLHMEHKQWERAMRVLLPLWQTLSWRKAGWWSLLEEVGWAVRECARSVRDAETLVAVEWELMSRSLTQRQDSDLDIANVLEPLKPLSSRPKSVIRAENILSCISATFAFESSHGNIGEPLESQLVLSSHAHPDSRPVTISYIKIVFEGGLKNVQIDDNSKKRVDKANANGQVELHHVPLGRSSSDADSVPSSPAISTSDRFLFGTANLMISAGSTKALALNNVPRDAGEVEVSSITLFVNEADYDIELVLSEDEQMCRGNFFSDSADGISRRELQSDRSNAVKILPRPPKMRLELLNLERDYYTDEIITFDLEVINEEQDNADVSLDAHLLVHSGTSPILEFLREEADNGLEDSTPGKKDEKTAASKYLGNLNPSGRQRHNLRIHRTSQPAQCVLELDANYHLSSDLETPISKRLNMELAFQRPFEANYSFLPVIHPDPWPDYFDIDDIEEVADSESKIQHRPEGLIQRWSLSSRITSLATAALIVEHMEPQANQTEETAICSLRSPHKPSSKILPSEVQEQASTLDVQKMDLDDRASTHLDLRLQIKWRRSASSAQITTHLPLPELILPFGEPRVLASSRNDTAHTGAIHVDYVIENPSIYSLTFNLIMDTSEEFAFSGPKNINVQLVPMSRYIVRYVLLPFVKGMWINPQFRVYDTHFHKMLKVNGAEGMRNDKKGVSIWVDADD